MPISAKHTKFDYPDYIAPLPADDFIKVAIKKQEMFDEGVAKIQTNLDSVSALRNNIKTEAERAYFDETLQNIVKATNDSAGVDFSIKANTQAVLNIGKPLENDKYIKTAILNGKEIDRRSQVLSKLDSSKRSANNDYLFMKDAYDYISTNKLGQSISYEKPYEEFYDISEDWNKFFKNLPQESQEEFTKSGYTPTGYFEKVTTEGFTRSKVGQMFESYLSTNPKALRQLQIDAQVGLDKLGKQEAHKGYVEYMTQQVGISQEQVKNLQDVVATKERSYAVTKSPTLKAELEQAKQALASAQQTYLFSKEAATTPLEDFDLNDYYGIYKNNMINNMANLYAGQKIKRDLKEDKLWEQQQEYNKLIFKHNLEKEQISFKAKVEGQKPENLLKERKETMELYKVDAQDFKLAPSFFDPSTVNTDVDNKTIKDLTSNIDETLRFVPLEEKVNTKVFLENLKAIKPQKYYVVTMKNGTTAVATGESLQQLKKYQFDEIESFAESNETSIYSQRRNKSTF